MLGTEDTKMDCGKQDEVLWEKRQLNKNYKHSLIVAVIKNIL